MPDLIVEISSAEGSDLLIRVDPVICAAVILILPKIRPFNSTAVTGQFLLSVAPLPLLEISLEAAQFGLKETTVRNWIIVQFSIH